MNAQEKHPYADILDHPHHVSAVHPPMPMTDRAAQFSSFAALKGYGEAVRNTARYAEEELLSDAPASAAEDLLFPE